jgi:hypothetical protein
MRGAIHRLPQYAYIAKSSVEKNIGTILPYIYLFMFKISLALAFSLLPVGKAAIHSEVFMPCTLNNGSVSQDPTFSMPTSKTFICRLIPHGICINAVCLEVPGQPRIFLYPFHN